MDIESISLMPYCHADWAWNYYRSWHEKRYLRAFEVALDLMDADAEFTWFVDTYTDQFRVVVENRPDLLERMKRRVSEGRFGISGGLYANPHPDRAGREAYIRNAVYGRRLFLGHFPDVDLSALTQEDVVIGHSQLPQVLRKLGYVFFTSSRSAGALAAKKIPRQFVWVGLDGTKLLTEWSHYGGLTPDLIPDDFQENWEAARKPFAAWAEVRMAEGSSPDLMCLQGGGDDSLPLCGRGDRPGPYFEFLRAWRRREKAALVFSTPARFAKRLAARRDLPEWRGPLDPVGWSYWYSQNGKDSLWRLRLQAEKMLAQAEQALVHYGKGRYPQREMEALWLDALSVWSHATLWLWAPDYEQFLVRIRHVIQRADAMLESARKAAVAGIAPQQEGRPVVLFNPTPWERTEVVEIPYALDESGAEGMEVVDADGRPVPAQVCPDSFHPFPGGKLRECTVHAQATVPASGFATVYVRHRDTPENRARQFLRWPGEIDVSCMRAKTEQGRVGAVTLAGLGRTLCSSIDLLFEEIDEGAGYRNANRADLFAAETDGEPVEPWSVYHYGKVVGRSFYTAHRWALVEDGPLVTRMASLGETAGNETEWEIKFYHGHPRADVRLRIYVTHARSGYFLASVGAPFEGAVHADIPWGVEARQMQNEPFGMEILERRDFQAFCALSWADVSDDEGGVAVLAEEGQQGFRLRERRLEHFLLKTIAPENIRGRRWSHSYRTGLGAQEFRFAVFLHKGTWREGRLYREVEAYRQPIAARDFNFRLSGRGMDRRQGLSVTPANAMVSGFYREGDATLLRLYENEGRRTRATVLLPFDFTRVRRVDMTGRDEPSRRRPSLSGGKLCLTLAPWEIVTLALT